MAFAYIVQQHRYGCVQQKEEGWQINLSLFTHSQKKTDTPARPAACPFSVRKIRGSGFQPGALRSYLPGWLPLLFVTLIILFSLTEIYRRTQISLPNPSKWPFHYANKCILCKILYIFSPFGSKRISSLSTPRIKKSTTA